MCVCVCVVKRDKRALQTLIVLFKADVVSSLALPVFSALLVDSRKDFLMDRRPHLNHFKVQSHGYQCMSVLLDAEPISFEHSLISQVLSVISRKQ